MTLLLWIAAVICAIAGIVSFVRGNIVAGIALVVLACIIGPGGYSIFHE